MESHKKEAASYEEKASSTSVACSLILRAFAVAATMAAAIVLAVDEETKTINISIAPTLPPFPVDVTARTRYSSAFVYFIVANSIACFYSASSLILLSLSNKGRRMSLVLLLATGDVIMLVLLFSSTGAATAIGVVGERGLPKVGWNKVCNVYTKYCAHIMASIGVSFAASLAYVALVLLSLVGLHNKSS